MGATVVAGLVLLVGVVNLSLRKHVNLVVDGQHQTVSTTSNSVQDLLADEGLTLSSAVLVQPSPTSSIADGMTVVVRPARVASGAEAFLTASAPSVTREAPAVFESPTDVGVWVMAGTSMSAVDPTDLLVESDFSASSVGQPMSTWKPATAVPNANFGVNARAFISSLLASTSSSPAAPHATASEVTNVTANRPEIRARGEVSRAPFELRLRMGRRDSTRSRISLAVPGR